MMDVMVVIGLLIVAIGWLVQLFFLYKKDEKIRPGFIILYMIGILLLIINGLINGIFKNYEFELSLFFEIITFISAGLVLLKLFINRKKT